MVYKGKSQGTIEKRANILGSCSDMISFEQLVLLVYG